MPSSLGGARQCGGGECAALCCARALPRSHGGWCPVGAASALAVVHFQLPVAVNIHEVVGGFPRGIDPIDLVFQMPRLEDTADAIRAIMPLDEILHGPSLER